MPEIEPDKKRKRRRRIFDLKIDEISLVDSPAVPAATFLLVKREATPVVIDAVARQHIRTPATDVERVMAHTADDVIERAGQLLLKRRAEQQRCEAATWGRVSRSIQALAQRVESMTRQFC